MREMQLEDVQRVSLDVLKDVHEFCIENDSKYTLWGGTLIGAIRNHGFIPWDDDIDIAMTRSEYDKFVRLYHSKHGYELFAREKQGKDILLAFARVCDMDRTYVDTAIIPWNKKATGVWIDVFPLDGAEPEYEKAVKQSDAITKIWHLSVKVKRSRASFSTREGLVSKMKLLALRILYGWRMNIWDKHINMCRKIRFDQSTNYSNFSWCGFGMKEYYQTKAFDGYMLQRFEDCEFSVMQGYDGALRSKYGDYMQLPPEEERVPRHSVNKFYWKN